MTFVKTALLYKYEILRLIGYSEQSEESVWS